jgi:uncharacterized protein (DUF1810 family)
LLAPAIAARLAYTSRRMSVDASQPWGDTSDPFRLERFVRAQSPVYSQVVSELSAGRKRGHWIWFIFPQVRGLGSSPTSQEYAITSLDEAIAYVHHPTLGTRLRECVGAVNSIEGRTIQEILGADDVKFCSSMTLFAQADPGGQLFADALKKYFGGRADERTLELL